MAEAERPAGSEEELRKALREIRDAIREHGFDANIQWVEMVANSALPEDDRLPDSWSPYDLRPRA